MLTMTNYRSSARSVFSPINNDVYVNVFIMYDRKGLTKNKSPCLAQTYMKLENVRVCNISNSYTLDRLDGLRKGSLQEQL